MNERQILLIIILAVVFMIFLVIVNVLDLNSLNGIKSKTIGNGQHGTARFATKREVNRAFSSLLFEPGGEPPLVIVAFARKRASGNQYFASQFYAIFEI